MPSPQADRVPSSAVSAPAAPGADAQAELHAPSAWRAVDFIADLHLEPAQPATWAAWRDYLLATPADAVFLLGDIFEVWIGDDAASPGSFEEGCAAILAQAARHRALYFLPGNRDFLLGADYLARCGMQRLPDPVLLSFAGQRWLLSHGDALCLEDRDYQVFRQQVRTPSWQQQFLAQPLARRHQIARQIRAQSQTRHHTTPPGDYADADPHLAAQWLGQHRADVLIHGHTHRPAEHRLTLPDGRPARRVVLSDWDAPRQRLQVLRGTPLGLTRIDLC